MPKTPDSTKKAQLSPTQRSAIIAAHGAGVSQAKLAAKYGCTPKTIYNTLKRYKDDQIFINRPKSGRPHILTDRAKRHLFLQARQHPSWTYKQLSAALPDHPSPRVICRILKGTGLQKYQSVL